MIKKIIFPFIMLSFCFCLNAQANDFKSFKQAVADARESLLTMLKDPSKRGADQQALVKKTADKTSEILGALKAPAGKEAQFAEMKKNWEDFKKTRETELVPAILAGKQEEADKIAQGIQRGRLKKVMEIVDSFIGE